MGRTRRQSSSSRAHRMWSRTTPPVHSKHCRSSPSGWAPSSSQRRRSTEGAQVVNYETSNPGLVSGEAPAAARRRPQRAVRWASAGVPSRRGARRVPVDNGQGGSRGAAYRTIDLHFHALRHEAGSRWLEQGLPLHHVKELLGHASISTTDTYLERESDPPARVDAGDGEGGESDTHVPHMLPPQPERSAQERGKKIDKSLLH